MSFGAIVGLPRPWTMLLLTSWWQQSCVSRCLNDVRGSPRKSGLAPISALSGTNHAPAELLTCLIPQAAAAGLAFMVARPGARLQRRRRMKSKLLALGLVAATAAAALWSASIAAQAQQQPNIVVIMGDDIGIWNIGAYHQGMMAGRTPNLDKIAAEGMLFTDYYSEASCTAGRATFTTGELPIRTGMTTVGQAGSTAGFPAEA